MSKAPAFFDLYRVGDDGLEPQNSLVKLAGLVEVERRETNVGKSSVSHVLILMFGFLMTVGGTFLLALSALF